MVLLVVLVDLLCRLGEWMQVALEHLDRAVGEQDDCRRHAYLLHHDHLCDRT